MENIISIRCSVSGAFTIFKCVRGDGEKVDTLFQCCGKNIFKTRDVMYVEEIIAEYKRQYGL